MLSQLGFYRLFTHFFRIASLALEQLYDCSSGSEATLKDVGKSISSKPKETERSVNRVHNLWDVCTSSVLHYRDVSGSGSCHVKSSVRGNISNASNSTRSDAANGDR